MNSFVTEPQSGIAASPGETTGRCGGNAPNGIYALARRAEPLHFFGNMAFSLNPVFLEEVEKRSRRHWAETGKGLRYYIPIPGDTMEIMDGRHTESVDDLPEVITSIGFENIFQTSFRERFIAGGHLRATPSSPVQPAFEAAGFIDPEGLYTIHAVTPYVFLVDRVKLGNLEPPGTWEDILHPRYRNKVICNGSRDHFSYILLFYIYRMAGLEGVMRLAGNVRDALHAGLIARIAGRPPSCAAVYILPWFFAKVCPWTDDTTIIWPSDGAIVSPMWLLSKDKVSPEGEIFIRLIAGAGFGEKAAAMFSPVANATVDNRLPPGATFRWLGWDFIHGHDPMRLKKELLDVFRAEWRPGG